MQFESYQSIVDPPLQSCPACHGSLERIITGGSGIIFKGSGFYITDYAKKNSTQEKSTMKKKEPAKATNKEKNKQKTS